MKREASRSKRKYLFFAAALLIIAAAFVAGCSESRFSSLSLVDDQGNHPGGWADGHTTWAVSSSALCTDCHGDSLDGGIANTSCLQSACHHDTITSWATTPEITHGDSAKKRRSGSFGFVSCQICHGEDFTGSTAGATPPPSCLQSACHGTPATTNPPHPTAWRTGDTFTHTSTSEINASVCEDCHRDGLNSPIAPPSPPASSATAAGCFNSTLCHDVQAGAPHATNPYSSHPADAVSEFTVYCSDCHSIDPPTPNILAPACTTCHAGGSPLVNTSCTSCHAAPPDSASPVGATAPNVEGAHTEHNALANITDRCNTCHDGGGTGTGLLHYYNNTVDMAASDATYDATAGAAVLSTTTCVNVSCHGGITTPDWQTGAIIVNSDAGCLQCHQDGTAAGVAGDPEDNSFYSGEHDRHVNGQSIVCSECHDMSGDANHFSTLNTPAMEGPASGTFSNSTGSIIYNATAGTCSGTCHGQNHNPESW